MNRETIWEEVIARQPWDILVVGGGITGAGVFREAVRLGVRALLLEQRDFAWGTSSRSGKLVHGGLRYLRQGDLHLTWESAREREHLLREAPGLVEPLGFLIPVYNLTERLVLGLGLAVYDLCVGRRHHRYVPEETFWLLAPHVNRENLRGGFWYREASTDDARLVLRLIWEGIREGGWALNYARVLGLLRRRTGQVVGVVVRDEVTGKTAEVMAQAVVNATGAWADRLRGELGQPPRMRPLRGTHLLFPGWRFPLAQAVGFFHPVDRRPLYALPWAGATLVGTTDVDHTEDLEDEPRATGEEVAYLLTALRHAFPHLDLEPADVLATFAGVRPVVGRGKEDPSREPREHTVWYEDGLLTVTGGKLTTFRVLAHDALRVLRRHLRLPVPFRRMPLLDTPPIAPPTEMDTETWRWLLGRYGKDAPAVIASASPEMWARVGDTPFRWAEVWWALQREQVVHLDDLLLRRVRVGLLLPDGGMRFLAHIKPWCQRWLGWDDARWQAEVQRYQELLRTVYQGPEVGNG